MKIFKEESLRNFKFWSGGKDRADNCTSEQLDQIEDALNEIYPNGMDETQINDLFWFEFDTVANWLGYESEEAFDFCNEFEVEEREIEIGGKVYTLELSHGESYTTITDDITTEEFEVSNGMSVEEALASYKEMLIEALSDEDEDDED